MTGLFITLLTIVAVGAPLVAGFGITWLLIRIFKGREAAAQFKREEW